MPDYCPEDTRLIRRSQGCKVNGLHGLWFDGSIGPNCGGLLALKCSLDWEMSAQGLNAKQLAEKAGVTEATVSKLRTNRFSLIDAKAFEKICVALNRQPGDLLHLEDDLPMT